MGIFKICARSIAGLVLVSLLCACQSRNQPGVITSYRTGETAIHSKMVSAPTPFGESILAIAAYLPRQGYLVIAKRCGFLGWSNYSKAVSNGRPIPMESKGQLSLHGCAPEIITLYLTQEEFYTAAQRGFQATLIGQRSTSNLALTPEPFQEVVARNGQAKAAAPSIQRKAPQRKTPEPEKQPLPDTSQAEPHTAPRGIVTGI